MNSKPELPTLKELVSERRIDRLWKKIDQLTLNNSMANMLNSTARHAGWSREHHATVLAAVMMLQLAEQNERILQLMATRLTAPIIIQRPGNIHNIDTPDASMPVDTLDRGAGC